MKKTLLAVFLGLLLFPLALLGDESVKIGEAALKVPLLPGFVRLDGANADVDKLMNGLVPPTNRQLLVLAPQGDVDKAKAGSPGILSRYMLLQTFKAAEAQTLSLKDFGEVLSTMQSQLGDAKKGAAMIETEVNKTLKNANGANGPKLSDTRMLGIYEKTDRSIDMGMLSNAQAGNDKPQTIAGGASILLVRGKMVYLYVYSQLNSAADVSWTEKTVKAWREAVLAANPE